MSWIPFLLYRLYGVSVTDVLPTGCFHPWGQVKTFALLFGKLILKCYLCNK